MVMVALFFFFYLKLWLSKTGHELIPELLFSYCKFFSLGKQYARVSVFSIPFTSVYVKSFVLFVPVLGLAPEIPEDLYHLIKKAVSIRKHLERNRKDKDSKFRLILVESRIHRLARYYKKTKKLPPVWK